MESNVQASPKDIAEYVFWTGDEKSVTSAIEDYMRAGLVSFLFREHIPRPKTRSKTDETIQYNNNLGFNLRDLK